MCTVRQLPQRLDERYCMGSTVGVLELRVSTNTHFLLVKGWRPQDEMRRMRHTGPAQTETALAPPLSS